MNTTGRFTRVRRHRAFLTLTATVLVGLAAIPSAQSSQDKPVLAGQYNDSTAPTVLENTGTSGTTLAATKTDGTAIWAFASGGAGAAVLAQSAGGTGVVAKNTSAIHSALSAENTSEAGGSAIEALNHAPNWTAIYGHHDATTNGYGVYGEAPIGIGVQGRGSVYGVRGFTDDPSGRGVYAQNTTGGTALETAGAVRFSSAGLATIPTGAKQVTIPAGVDVTSTTKVLVTPMSAGGTLRFVEADAGTDTLTFRLAKAATTNLKLAYFVIS